MPKLLPITALGQHTQGGTYLLRIAVQQPLQIRFGRFKKGQLIQVSAGEYIYVGSALSQKGAMSLARRLVRHASRSGQQAAHPIREQLISFLTEQQLGTGNLLPKSSKKLYWNVDHLLDQNSAELTHIIFICSPQRLEAQLGQWLQQDSHTAILEKGLGANDVPGNTHLLRVLADEGWWIALPQRLKQFLADVPS